MSYTKYQTRIFVDQRLQAAYDRLDDAFLPVEESEHGANGNMTLSLKIESLLRQLAAREEISERLLQIWNDESDKALKLPPLDIYKFDGRHDLGSFAFHRMHWEQDVLIGRVIEELQRIRKIAPEALYSMIGDFKEHADFSKREFCPIKEKDFFVFEPPAAEEFVPATL